MQILELFWMLWQDGWTGDHWVSIVWTTTTTAMVPIYAVIAYWNWRDAAPLRRINRPR